MTSTSAPGHLSPVTHNLTLMTMGGRIDAWLAEAFMEVVWEIAVT
jgi:hypothetical protein